MSMRMTQWPPSYGALEIKINKIILSHQKLLPSGPVKLTTNSFKPFTKFTTYLATSLRMSICKRLFFDMSIVYF